MAAMLTARLASGVAPHLAVFDVFKDASITLPPDNASGDPDPAIWYWFWNFGDGACGCWGTTSKSKNTATGMVAGHVYDKPGTYTATLRSYDTAGVITTYTETITVTDPEVVYASTTLYYSSTGLDANAGTKDSPCLTATQAFGTGAKGVFNAAGPRRVLLKRGESYDLTTTPAISAKTGPYHIGTWGDDAAADPIVNVADNVDGFLLEKDVTLVRMVDIDMRGPVIGFGLANFEFGAAGSWTEGAGWSIAGGLGVAALGATSDLSQNATGMTVGRSYETCYTVARTAGADGSITLKLGTGAGVARTASGTFNENLTCTADTVVRLTKATSVNGAFTVDNIYIVTARIGIQVGTDCLFLRCSVDRFNTAFSSTDTEGTKDGTGIVECVFGSQCTSYACHWGLGYRSAIMGNVITLDGNYANEHMLRIYLTHSCINHNSETGGGRGKHHIRLAGFYASTGLTNDEFTDSPDAAWTKGASWTIAGGVATKAGAGTDVMSQTIVGAGTGLPRLLKYTATRTGGSAGSTVTLRFGGTSGTAIETGTRTETLNPASGALLEFVPQSGWEGTIDFTPTASQPHMDTVRNGDEQTEKLEYTWITDNISPSVWSGNTPSTIPYLIGINNSGDATFTQNCVVERNKIVVGTGNSRAIDLDGGASYVYCRNNVIDFSAAPTSNGITVRRSGATSANPTGNMLLNTTGISSASFSGSVCSAASSAVIDTVFRNTHLCKNGGAGVAVTDSGTNSTTTDSATDTTTAGIFTMPTDARPAAASGARGVGFANAASSAHYVRDSYDRITRMTTRNEAGAFEIGFTQTAPTAPGFAIGMNLDRASHTTTQWGFVDVAKQMGEASASFGWLAKNATTPFGSNATLVTAMTDSEYHPNVTIPFNNGNGDAILQARFQVCAAGTPPAGAYTVFFDGAGTLDFTGDATATVTTSGSTITITPTTAGVTMRVMVTTANNPIRNIRIVMPGFVSTYATDPWHPDLITKLGRVKRVGTRLVIRTMEWTRNNGTRPAANIGWANRCLTTWASQATSFGVAWEYVARLCNALGADAYINITHQDTEADIRALAQLMLAELDSTRDLYIEPPNESLWNGAQDQTGAFQTAGNTAGFSGTASVKGRKYYCKFAAEAFDIFLSEWGEAHSGRLHFVGGVQASATSTTDDLMDFYEEVTIDSVPVNVHATKLHACALAPYFGLHTSTADRFGDDGVDDGWYLTDTAAEGIDRIPSTYRPLAYTNMDNQIASLAVYAAIAAKPYTGIKAVTYEAGRSIVSSGANTGNANLTTFLQGVCRDAGMKAVFRDYINHWRDQGSSLMVIYQFCRSLDGVDMWAVREYLDQPDAQAPAYQAAAGIVSGGSNRAAVLTAARRRIRRRGR